MIKFRFFLSEAFESLRLSGAMTTITIMTTAISLFLVGSFYLSMSNVDKFIRGLKEDFQVLVFIKDNVDQSAVETELAQIRNWPEVREAVFISPLEARKIFLEGNPDEEILKVSREVNDLRLPGSLKILLRDSDKIEEIAHRFEGFAYVDEVVYGKGVANHLFGIVGIYNYFSITCIFLLGFACLFIVSNTIKLNILNRAEEIEIMKLVGATPWFIRWPFLIEGLLQGMAGATIASILLVLFYPVVLTRLTHLAPFFPAVGGTFFLLRFSFKLMVFGSLLGSLGSLFSLRNMKTV